MNFSIKDLEFSTIEALIYPIYEDESLENICECVREDFSKFKGLEKFKAEAGEVFSFNKCNSQNNQDIIFLGLGKKADIDPEKIRIFISKAFKRLRN